jgi:hypothetical protein
MKTGKDHHLSKYTEEIGIRIAELISGGMSVKSICEREDMPCRFTFYEWIRKYPEFAAIYAIAKNDCADYLVEEILEIADDGTNDYTVVNAEDGGIAYKTNGEVVARSRLRVDTRKWIAGKLKPKKYGDISQVRLGDADGGKIVFETAIRGTPNSAAANEEDNS